MTITPGQGPAPGGMATYAGICPLGVRIVSVGIAVTAGCARHGLLLPVWRGEAGPREADVRPCRAAAGQFGGDGAGRWPGARRPPGRVAHAFHRLAEVSPASGAGCTGQVSGCPGY